MTGAEKTELHTSILKHGYVQTIFVLDRYLPYKLPLQRVHNVMQCHLQSFAICFLVVHIPS